MAFSMSFCPCINHAEAPVSSASWIRCMANTTNVGEVTTILTDLLSGIYSPTYNDNVTQGWRSQFPFVVRNIGVGGCDYNAGISNWTPNLRSAINVSFSTQNELDEFNNVLSNHILVVKIVGKANFNGEIIPYPFFYFKKLMPVLTGSTNLISDVCLTDLPDINNNIFNVSNSQVLDHTNNTLTFQFDSSESCTDLRSSSSTSEFLITINGVEYDGNQTSRSYNLLIQPDSTHTTGTINIPQDSSLNTSFMQMVGCSCRMLDNGCCHGAGRVDVYGTVQIFGIYWSEVTGEPIDMFLTRVADLDEENVLLFRARFDDECCCYPTGYTDDVTDLINNYISSLGVGGNIDRLTPSIKPTKIVWAGFERLSDFCCDDSDCSQSDDYEFDIEYPPISGGGGGGGDVDISCICDGLTALRQTLSTKLDSLIEGQGIIAEAIDDIEVSVDNECICDNLEAIKGSIDDLELSVTNSPQINVQPCQPIVTNPVNNITVQPSQAEITVQPCQPIVTNPVNNITVQPSQAEITVQPCQPTIQNVINEGDITIDNDDLIEKLDELFKSDDETITDVIKNKDMGSNIDVEVSPADDVNINRVYYTNQRNGDTSIND